MNANGLTAADYEMFARFGIGSELLTIARIGRVTDAEARRMFAMTFSGDLSGIAFPYFPPVNNGHSKDLRWMVRLRRDNPEIKDGKPVAKYLCEYGAPYKHLYFVPGSEDLLKNALTPVVLVEAEKSALGLWAWNERNSGGILPIAMGGCFGWLGKRGRDENGPSVDLDYCNGRNVIILLDSNAGTKQDVRKARTRLGQELLNRDCTVRIAELPEVQGLNGPDDAIAISGDQIIADVLRNARYFADVARSQMESQIASAAEKDGRVTGEFIEQCEEFLAAIPKDEEREILTGRLHKALKGAVTKATIKDAVAHLRAEHAEAKKKIAEQARQGELKKEVVDAGVLVANLERYFSERAHLPEGAALALSYFAINTWTFDIFDTTPYLDIESAVPGCGKTTVISLLRICREAVSATGLTEAAMFRIVSERRPTLLLDEAEFLEGKSDRAQYVRAIANVGYKTGAQVPRCEGDEHEIVWFEVYGPKVFAVIGGVTGTLLERSIVIHMEKKPGGKQLKKTRERVLERDAKPLLRQLEAYALQRRSELNDLYDKEPDEGYWPQITDREAEIWGPLLIHAKLAGVVAEMRLLAACEALTKQKTDIQDEDYLRALASEIRDALQGDQKDGEVVFGEKEQFTPADLLGFLNGTENWGAKLAKYKDDDSKSKSAAIGRFLRKFRFKTRTRTKVGMAYLKAEVFAALSSVTPKKSFTSCTLSRGDANPMESKPVNGEAEKTPSFTDLSPGLSPNGSNGETRDLFADGERVKDVKDKSRGEGIHILQTSEGDEIDWHDIDNDDEEGAEL